MYVRDHGPDPPRSRHEARPTCAPRDGSVSGMHPSPRHHTAESRFRELLRSNELAEPDRVEYAPGELTFFWEESKLAVVVELDDPAPIRPPASAPR